MAVRRTAAVGALALATLGLVGGLASGATESAGVSVGVPRHPRLDGNVRVAISGARKLPAGGYYYAVVVLTEYPGYSSASPPPCAVSSDMHKTVYGFPRRGRGIALTLIPARSVVGRWCAGGVYRGAIYAVPHAPRCTHSYPCYGTHGESGPCWQVEGRRVCGVVVAPETTEKPTPGPPRPVPPAPEPEVPPAKPGYSYPGGLPKPVDRSTRVVARFALRF
jgi:hypothetical protein